MKCTGAYPMLVWALAREAHRCPDERPSSAAQFSHFETKYRSRNNVIEQNDENVLITLLFNENHFFYVNNVERLLAHRDKSGKNRKAFLCFNCLSMFDRPTRLKVSHKMV